MFVVAGVNIHGKKKITIGKLKLKKINDIDKSERKT